MREEDLSAVLELASELTWSEAIQFIRSETGDNLRTCVWVAENRIPSLYPESNLAKDVQRRTADLEREV